MAGEAALEVWRGGVNTWECDEMGHLNVRFYVARAMEGLVGLTAAMGLQDAFRPSADTTVLVREQHIRFLREARSRAALHMVAGVVDIRDTDARVLQLLIHSGSGEIAASFQTVVRHVTARDGRAFPWSHRTRALAEALMVSVPPKAAPRSIDPEGAAGAASLSKADAMGLIRLGAGAFGPQDCDAFGRMRPEIFIGRVSDGIPRLAGAFRDAAADSAAEGGKPTNVGGAVLEYRLLHHAWPRAGDRFEIRSGLVGVDARTQRLAHWMLDPATGQAWGAAEAVAVALDLDARKIIPIGDEAQAAMRKRITPGLGL